jgi:hypothetical protein
MLTGAFRQFHGYDIPPQEVAELYKLYTQTGGPSWIDHTNWFANKQCATWYGLTVAGGRVTQIQLAGNNLVGTTNFTTKPFAALSTLNLSAASSTSDLHLTLSGADIPASLRSIYLYYNLDAALIANTSEISQLRVIHLSGSARSKISGPVSQLSPLLSFIDLSGTQSDMAGNCADFASSVLTDIVVSVSPVALVGPLSDLPVSITKLQVHGSLSQITGGDTPVKCIGIRTLYLGSQVQAPAGYKDDIINRLYADRVLFTNAAHSLNISDGPALTGVYQTSAAPSTPAEKAYALVNDPNGEGFLKWAITL